MRVGILAPPWVPVPPPAYGGTEMVVDLLARGLQDAGHDVLLAAASDSTCPVPRVPGMRASEYDALNGAVSALAHTVVAYAALRDVDLIHDHTLVGPLYRRRPPGMPIVATNHGPFTPDTLPVFRAIAPDTSIVAISHNQASHAHDCPIARVIHHGLDVERIPVGDGRGGFAAFLGRMTPEKGVAHALRIARAAGVPLRIAAKMREPAERAYFEAEVRPLLTREHEYIGEVSDAEKYVFLADAFALLNPIDWSEPFGLAMVEALATGTPVIATPRGSALEIVRPGVNGYLGTADELARLLPLASELDRATCRADVEARFSAQRMVEDHVGLYTDILAGHAGPGRRGSADGTPAGAVNGRGDGVSAAALSGGGPAESRRSSFLHLPEADNEHK
jgi:glycosyltransferase involved in cell wall biosynthesis